MRTSTLLALVAVLATLSPVLVAHDHDIRVPRHPQISPDGATVAFTWHRDIWLAPSAGGDARRLTIHPADDSTPYFSPDGRTIAFVSDRSGSSQIHLVPTQGGAPRQVTFDSARKRLCGFARGGESLIVVVTSDRGFHRSQSARAYELDVEGLRPRRMLLDAGVVDVAVSPDGDKVLFTRGRAAWNRKGYRGSQASQMWLGDLAKSPPELTRLDRDRPRFQNVSEKDPMWAPDSQGYYFVSDPDGTFDVYYRRLDGEGMRRVTRVGAADRSDDGVAFPSLSTDGKVMVFRRRFDLQRLDVAAGKVEPIELHATGDHAAAFEERRTESAARTIAFTNDGKQMAFVAGEDVWVMDRVLKEPVRVTNTPNEESNLVFSADGKRLFFVSDVSGEVDIWEATCKQEKGIWWLAKEFELRQVTDDAPVERRLSLSPTGKHVAYVKGSDVFVMDADGTDHRRVVEAWSAPSYDWSPDGQWLTYATQDNDYNSDVFVVKLDGTVPPYNLSRHPDRDGSPRWSPDGSRIAFVSRRDGDESDIYYVNLAKKVEEETDRDRRLKKAMEAMEKKKGSRGRARAGGEPGGPRAGRRGRRGGGRRRRGAEPPAGGSPPAPARPDADDDGKTDDDEKKKDEPVKVVVDFDGIHDRVHRIRNLDSSESGLIWSPDGKKLAFNASVDGARGLYTVSFPDVGRPKKMADSGLGSARWLKQGNEIVGLASGSSSGRGRGRRGRFGGGGGTPAAMSSRGTVTRFSFTVRRVKDWRAVRAISFDQGWRAMRDRFYDGNFNNRSWDAVREKYRAVAAECLGAAEFSDVMNMMLGELNASHMGHRGGTDPLPRPQRDQGWSPTTYHLGLRFSPPTDDRGLVVESVIPGGPCSRAKSLVEAGEVLLAIDGRELDRDTDLTRLLTMDEVRDLELTVADGTGRERKISVRPVRSVQGLLYDEWVERTRRQVHAASDGKLGYLHIRGMNMTSFRQMEEDLYHAGHGREGLIIDVRFNGGGSTTDHVLTALTQPRHAITVSRGSGEGYPQDRKVYASWHKPIVLMCNEHSFSNAEILSHAIKQIGRGQLVGMRTAGGVISTGGARLLDGSFMRMPTRGWYLVTTGEDMELNGCEPHMALWNPPGGPDLQLRAAIKALAEGVETDKARPGRRPIPASVRRRRAAGAAEGVGGGDH